MRRLLLAFLILIPLFAQHAVDPANRYYRVICLVHLSGSGKAGDPILPEYVPKPAATAMAAAVSVSAPAPTAAPASAAAARDGIIAWSSQLTDDKQMVIVHLVAVNHHAFDALLADARPEIKVFEIGKTDKAVIEAALKGVKANFTLDSIQVVAR